MKYSAIVCPHIHLNSELSRDSDKGMRYPEETIALDGNCLFRRLRVQPEDVCNAGFVIYSNFVEQENQQCQKVLISSYKCLSCRPSAGNQSKY